MTAAEFAEAYAARGNTTVERLRSFGRVPRPCDCDYEGCEGWQMAHLNALLDDEYWPEDSSHPLTRETETP